MSVHYYSQRHYHATPGASRSETLFRAEQLVWFTLAIVEIILLLRFGLRLLGANAAAPFADLVYSASQILLAPFRYILPAIRSGSSVLEWATLLAMGVYWLIAWGITRILEIARPDHIERIRI